MELPAGCGVDLGLQLARQPGIGLALVTQFAALHGGRAWVQDRPGGGASFRVFLPDTRSADVPRS